MPPGPGSRDTMRIDLQIEGAAALLRGFRDLPKEASSELRTSALALSDLLAQRVASAGRSEGRQAAVLASTVKAKRDRVPSLQIGGTRKLFHGRKDGTGKEAFRALFGSEFGSSRGHGFKPHRGAAGYWIWPTVTSSQPEIAKEWTAAAERIAASFSTGVPPRGAP